MNILTCKFVSASELVPVSWNEWFWEQFRDNAPFSWGDNNRTLISPFLFANHCEETLIGDEEVTEDEFDKWISQVRSLGNIYIDLES